MAFIKLNKGPQNSSHAEPGPAVRMGAHRTKTGKTVYISMTRKVVDAVGWKVDNTNENRIAICVAINEGVGEDSGFWLLTEDLERGYILGSTPNARHAFGTNLSAGKFRHYVLNDDSVPVDDVQFTVDEKDHSILVEIPEWLRYNPQSYKEPDKPKLELTPPKEDKKPARPTVRLSMVDGDERKEVPLNREQRRRLVSGVTRAMR